MSTKFWDGLFKSFDLHRIVVLEPPEDRGAGPSADIINVLGQARNDIPVKATVLPPTALP